MEETVSSFNIYCCNPFQKEGHKIIKNVRPVQLWMCSANEGVKMGMRICDSCRKQLIRKKAEVLDLEVGETNTPGPSNKDQNFIPLDVGLEYLNKSLSTLEESPVEKKRLKSQKYCRSKLGKIKKCLSENILVKGMESDIEETEPESEILMQLKQKFQQTVTRSEKIQILTVLPISWSCKKIEEEFNVSNRMARKVKSLVQEKGILSTPDSKPGRTLPESVIEKVENFYNSDEVSRLMPGKKDFVSLKKDNSRVHIQKRLVLGNLKEIYDLFKINHQTEKIGFSKFAELRPKNCILAGGSGTHSVCVCTTHQNVKLMISGAKLKEISFDDGATINNYKICLDKLMCDLPQQKCHLNECTNCPGTDNLKEVLKEKLEEEMIDHITYKQWVSVDRCNLETFTKSTGEFVDSFCEQLLVLNKHSFLAKQQSAFYNYLKENLNENETVVSCDFAENYSFVLQDEAQSYHWINDQATLYPIAVYFRDSEGLKYKSFVFISEHLKHDSVAVHLFNKRLIKYLTTNVNPEMKKIYYFSDGSAAQFKNRKNFVNLCHHKIDFGLDAEWHFYATAHGKGVCDGLGGTVKRLAAKASLQRPYDNQILTPFQFFTWSQANIPSIHFFYCTNQDHSEEEKLLEKRFLAAKPIPGTQKYHCFLPISSSDIQTKIFSSSNGVFTFNIQKK